MCIENKTIHTLKYTHWGCVGGVTWNNIVTGLKGIQTNVSGGWQQQCETMRDCVRNDSRSFNFVLRDNGLTMQPFHWAKKPHSSTENVCWMAKWMSVDRSLRKSNESCLESVLHALTWLWGKQFKKSHPWTTSSSLPNAVLMPCPVDRVMHFKTGLQTRQLWLPWSSM